MEDSDFRDSAGLPPPAWGSPSEAPADQADIQRPANDPSSAYQCGLASLLVGCTVGLASGLVIILATILFYGGPRGMPVVLAFATGLISVLVVAAASIGSVIFGIYGWFRAKADRASVVMPIAGVCASSVGLLAWIVAAADLVSVLGGFFR